MLRTDVPPPEELSTLTHSVRHHGVARGRLKVGDSFVHESIIGTMFNCRIEGEARMGANPAILPSVTGWARVIGHNTIHVDDRDPLAHGFQLS
jgi:proline racemase